jgi:predicted transcriptional regulator YheO
LTISGSKLSVLCLNISVPIIIAIKDKEKNLKGKFLHKQRDEVKALLMSFSEEQTARFQSVVNSIPSNLHHLYTEIGETILTESTSKTEDEIVLELQEKEGITTFTEAYNKAIEKGLIKG